MGCDTTVEGEASFEFNSAGTFGGKVGSFHYSSLMHMVEIEKQAWLGEFGIANVILTCWGAPHLLFSLFSLFVVCFSLSLCR